MNQTAYSFLLVGIGVAISFIGLLLIGGYLAEGESAVGAGIMWGYSIPAYLVLGLVFGKFSYGWYSGKSRVASQVTSLAFVAVLLALIGPLVTYSAFWIRGLFW